MMKTKVDLFRAGEILTQTFCSVNQVRPPAINRLTSEDRLYHLATCAYYRPYTIHIMVEKCAGLGMGGRAWSWPGYVVDRTPYGVLQHELGHHVDTVKSSLTAEPNWESDGKKAFLFSKAIYEQSKEPPLTGYLGTDKQEITFYMEWFAENFRLFVTNPALSAALRPKFFKAVTDTGLRAVGTEDWDAQLVLLEATPRIRAMAAKKVKTEAARRGENLALQI